MTDDKALEAARARVRLLEQTIAELRGQLSTRGPAPRNATPPADARPRRNSMRAPAVKPDHAPEIAELNASLEARRRDLETRTRERDEARAVASKRESEAEALRADRDRALATTRQRESEIETMRRELEGGRAKLVTAESERDQLRTRVNALTTQIETERARPVPAPTKSTRRNTAELEAQTTRTQSLERQLEALRSAWKTAEDRVQGLEAKLKQVRSVDTVAVLKAAADRAGELARLLEGAAVKLDPDEGKLRL